MLFLLCAQHGCCLEGERPLRTPEADENLIV
jgi:hypothetical protein